MQKYGFIFPGQGSQKLGMLSNLAGEYSVVKETFDQASDLLNTNLWEIAQWDSGNLLDRTDITQPVLLTASIAIWRIWEQMGCTPPAVMAGHSLGEYSALVCSGVIDFSDGIKLVHRRGELMQEAVSEGEGAMAAIVGMEDYQIREVCAAVAGDDVVSAANFNSPGQTVIAGTKAAVDRAMAACKEAGAKRALPLKVSVPSHCALMQPAAARLSEELMPIEFRTGSIPIIQNVNAQITTSADEIKANLIAQLYSPVLWVDSIKLVKSGGITTLIECGPGKVLCGLAKRIAPEIACFGSDDPQSLQQARDEVLV